MKIVFLGGAGAMAAALLPYLRDDPEITSVLLADRDAEGARKKAAAFGPKCSSVSVDATDHASLVGTMRGADVAIGYIGPFYRFEKPVAQAAIDAGVPYVSIADDYDAFLSVFELDDAAKKAGVKILTGFGNSPASRRCSQKKDTCRWIRRRKFP
ncbi:MAG: saccharopine dehydrogenase NADP-binding domain-containing protein [Deltaproteobacteria bacterium]|nr:saccharopine dehydrogenase NADP-binding domain-containing protein [Deltaproteobacteria bacterium]